jgi:ketosteroid isomerase-like protein
VRLHDSATSTVVLGYASEGRTVHNAAAYANHYVSLLTIAKRQVTCWRDYRDPLAVFDALGWPENY